MTTPNSSAIQRVKKFRVLRNEIPLCFHGSVNQIWTVCCMLCNFMTPLIQKDIKSGWFILNNGGTYTEFVYHFSISEKVHLAENTVFLKSSPFPRQKITGRSSRPEMLVKKLLLKLPLRLQENTCDSLFLIKLQAVGLQLYWKRLQHRCFPVSFAKFSGIRPKMNNILGQLLLDRINNQFLLHSVAQESLKYAWEFNSSFLNIF